MPATLPVRIHVQFDIGEGSCFEMVKFLGSSDLKLDPSWSEAWQHPLLSKQKKILDWHMVCNYMSRDVRKPVFGVSDQVRHKPGCAIT